MGGRYLMSRKGNEYERQVARDLSVWWSGGLADDWFWRIPGSGGRATNRAKVKRSTTGQYGDIEATCGSAKKFLRLFTVEVKRGYSASHPFDLIDRKLEGKGSAVQEFEGFCAQAIVAAGHAGTPLWLVIHRRDQRRAIAAFPYDLLNRLKEHGLTSAAELRWVDPQVQLTCYIRIKGESPKSTTIVIMPLEEFLNALSPDDVKALAGKRDE